MTPSLNGTVVFLTSLLKLCLEPFFIMKRTRHYYLCGYFCIQIHNIQTYLASVRQNIKYCSITSPNTSTNVLFNNTTYLLVTDNFVQGMCKKTVLTIPLSFMIMFPRQIIRQQRLIFVIGLPMQTLKVFGKTWNRCKLQNVTQFCFFLSCRCQ